MTNEEILKLLQQEHLSDDDKNKIIGHVTLMQEQAKESIKEVPAENETRLEQIKFELENVKSIMNGLAEKKAVHEEKDKAVLFELEKQVPEDFKKFIPDLPPREKSEWIRKVVNEGLFSKEQKIQEIGSEINSGNSVTHNSRVRAISQRDIAKMSDDDYMELKKSGKLDYLIRNNLIMD